MTVDRLWYLNSLDFFVIDGFVYEIVCYVDAFVKVERHCSFCFDTKQECIDI